MIDFRGRRAIWLAAAVIFALLWFRAGGDADVLALALAARPEAAMQPEATVQSEAAGVQPKVTVQSEVAAQSEVAVQPEVAAQSEVTLSLLSWAMQLVPGGVPDWPKRFDWSSRAGLAVAWTDRAARSGETVSVAAGAASLAAKEASIAAKSLVTAEEASVAGEMARVARLTVQRSPVAPPSAIVAHAHGPAMPFAFAEIAAAPADNVAGAGHAAVYVAGQRVEEQGGQQIDPKVAYAKLAAGDPTGGAEPGGRAYAAPEQPTVYLTFDDGPSKLTPKVLDILREHNVPATFFVLGQLAEQHEDMVRRIVREGHALGNHTYDHIYDKLYRNFIDFWNQVEKTDKALTEITGLQVRLLRAPGGTFGNFDAFYFYYLQTAGFSVHDWSLDAGDSKRRGVPAAEIVDNVKRAKLTHEVNILLHDGAGHQQTVEALPEIIAYFQEKGYRFAVLTDQVKPATSRVGPVKWKRTASEQMYREALAAVDRWERARPEGIPMQTMIAHARPEDESPAGVHDIHAEQRWVALREWAAGKGDVFWDAVTGTATLKLDGAEYRFRPAPETVARVTADQREVEAHIPFRLIDNKIYIVEDAFV